MIREAISKALERQDLDEGLAREAMREIMRGEATPAQIAGLLMTMRMKGESVEEITAFAQEMRENSIRISPRVKGRIVDTCGTGGDGLHTINVSTAAMFAAAGVGVRVAKHGNRSVSSRCGSADVLEHLGARIDLPPAQVEEIMENCGMCFMFAPVFHPAMKNVIGPRREIGARTVFNVLGPLTNPCDARGHVMGVYDAALTEKLARVAQALGMERAFVVHGEDGQDEISTNSKTIVSEVTGGEVRTYTITPQQLGLNPGKLRDLVGGEVETNAAMMVRVLSGFDHGPRRDAILANAAAAIAASRKHGSIADAMDEARESVDGGEALNALYTFIKATGGGSETVEGIVREAR